MERKKAEIIAHFNNIIENKDSVISSLNNIGKEIENAVNVMNTLSPSELRRSKHVLNLLQYELSFMKVLSEISYLVDTFAEDEELPSLSHAKSSLSLACSRTSSMCGESADNEIDIVTLKEQFQQLNEKIQTSCPAVLEYVASYYRNPSNISSVRDGIRPHNSAVLPSTSAPFVHPFENHYEVPEKDQVKSESVRAIEQIKSEKADGDHLNCDSRQQGVYKEPKVETLIDLSESVRKQQTCLDGVMLADVSMGQTYCPKEDNLREETLKNIKHQVDESESDSEIIEIMDRATRVADEGTSETTTTATESSSSIISSSTASSTTSAPSSSALEKLNNLQIHDRREHALKQLNPTYVPDLSLKPLLEDETANGVKVNVYSNGKLKKQKNRCANYIPKAEIELQEPVTPKEGQEAAFSYILTPSEFYLHIVDDQVRNIDKIGEQIHIYYDNSAPIFKTKTEAMALSGKYCVAYVLNSWYRVEILDWFMDTASKNDDVLVYLVDFGDKHKVSFTVLRHMPAEVANIPKLAVRCHLVYLCPPESTHVNILKEWPTASIDALVNLSGINSQNEMKFFRILYADKTGCSVSVDIENDADGDSVGQILMDLNLAVQIVDVEFAEDDENLNTFLCDAENLVEADDITEAVQGYSAKDESRVCKFVRNGKVCYRGDKCPFEHVDLTKDAFTTDTVLVHMDALSAPHLPSVGSQVIILVTGFIDICRFYVHIIHKPINVGNHLIDKSLYDLIEVMNHFDLTKIYSTFKIWPAEGEIVAVKHWATKKWLRGKVRHLIMDEDGQPNAAQVFMVDFGEIVDVPFTSIRQINQDFLHLPFQAMEVYLHDVQQRKDVDEETAHKFFLENICFKNFNATIMSSAEPLRVSVQTMRNTNISGTLIRLGLAEEKEDDLLPAEDCKIQPA